MVDLISDSTLANYSFFVVHNYKVEFLNLLINFFIVFRFVFMVIFVVFETGLSQFFMLELEIVVVAVEELLYFLDFLGWG